MYHSIYSNLYYSIVHSKLFSFVDSQLAIIFIRGPKLAPASSESETVRDVVISKDPRRTSFLVGKVGVLVLGVVHVGVRCWVVVKGTGYSVWL